MGERRGCCVRYLCAMRHNLSDASALMRDRRSFAPEDFSGRKVQRDVVEEILRAGTWAPTHGMTQPWRFTVFMDEGLDALRQGVPAWYEEAMSGKEVNAAKRDRLARRMDTCNCVIGVGMVPDVNGRISREDEEWAVASAIQNMHLMCTAYGLGAKWTTPAFMKLPAVREALALPAEGKVMGLFYVGYPAKAWPMSHRWPLEYITRWQTSAERVVAHESRPKG